MTITTHSAEETLRLGQKLGKVLRGREVLELKSDIGGGKTTFTKGIAEGMGSNDTVQSPTFTISLHYQCSGRKELHHYDFYRLHDAGVVQAQLAESLHQDDIVTVIEWSDVVAHVLHEPVVVIYIKKGSGENDREFLFEIPEEFSYLNEAISK